MTNTNSQTSVLDHQTTTRTTASPVLRESELTPFSMYVKNHTVNVYAGVFLPGHVIKQEKGFGFYMCVMECLKTVDCHSVNFMKNQGICQLNSISSGNPSLKLREGCLYTRSQQWPKVCL